MDRFTKAELEDALAATRDMAGRGVKAQQKFAPGTAQHTLQQNRLRALAVAERLMEQALAGAGCPAEAGNAQDAQTPLGAALAAGAAACTREELEHAAAPIASLASKSTKAQQKLAPGTWQHTMLEKNIKALAVAQALLAAAQATPPAGPAGAIAPK